MSPDGILYIVDVRHGKWDSDTIINELLATQKAWNVNTWTFETAKIDKAIGPFLNRAMQRNRIYLNIHKETPTQSKTMRASSIKGMHRSRSIRYDKEAEWYKDFNEELSMVSASGPRGKHDDMFDAFAYLGLTIDMFWEAQSDEEMEDEEYEMEYEQYHSLGRCASTGY
jgi:predicted phage terminase large subunit-like protein